MNKKLKILSTGQVLVFVFILFSAVSCKGFLEGASFKEELDGLTGDAASKMTVTVKDDENQNGYFSSSWEKTYKVGESFEIEFTVSSGYEFSEFTCVDTDSNEVLPSCVEFVEMSRTSRGSYSIVKYKATINNYCKNISVKANCFNLNDSDRPEFIENDGFVIKAAESADKMAAGESIPFDTDIYGASKSEFLENDSATIELHRVKDLYVKLNATDESSRVNRVRVVETFLYNTSCSSASGSKTLDVYDSFNKVSEKVYSAEFNYTMKSPADGYYRLDFYVIDDSGNISEEKKSIYVIKDTFFSSYLTIPPVLNVTALSQKDAGLIRGGYNTFANDVNIAALSVNLTKTYCMYNIEKFAEDVNVRYLISQNNIDWEEIIPETMTFQGVETENCINFSAYDRYSGFYVKAVLCDSFENSVETDAVFFICPAKAYLSGANTYTSSSGTTYYIYLVPKQLRPDFPLVTYSSSTGTPNLYKYVYRPENNNFDFYSTIVNIKIDPEEPLEIYYYPNINTTSTSFYGYYGEKYVILYSDCNYFKYSDYFNVSGNESPVVDITSFVSEGLNSGKYKITGSITNYDRIFRDSSGNYYEPEYYTVNFSYNTREVYTFNTENFEFTIPARKASCYINVSCYRLGMTRSSSKTIPSMSDNVSPETGSSIFNLKSPAGSYIYIPVSDGYYSSQNFKTTLFIDETFRNLTEEEILQLPQISCVRIDSTNHHYYYATRGLKEKLYQAYFYVEDECRNYSIKKFIINNIYTSNDFIYINDDGSINISAYQKPDTSFSIDYSTRGFASASSVWGSASYSLSDPTFKRFFYVCYSSGQNTGYRIVPFVWYSGEKCNCKYKKIMNQRGEITVQFDHPVLCETAYCKYNLGSDRDEWYKQMLFDNTNAYSSTGVNCDSYSGIVQTKMIKPANNGTVEYKNFKADTANVPEGCYYCVIVHFADGTSAVSDVWYKD
jgi:hypothetical protein